MGLVCLDDYEVDVFEAAHKCQSGTGAASEGSTAIRVGE